MQKFAVLVLSLVSLSVWGDDSHPAYGSRYRRPQYLDCSPKHGPQHGVDTVRRWNEIAINASGVDHTPVAPGEPRVFGEQLGPGRSSRAMAIVHIAMFDTVNSLFGGYENYAEFEKPKGYCSPEVAISQAAHDTLVALFPSQEPSFDRFLAEDLAQYADPSTKANSILLGQRAAEAILALRAGDGSEIPEPRVGVEFIPSILPGHWRQDPISQIPLALGAHWSQCRPFVLESAKQFRVLPPPALTSPAYTAAFNEVKMFGGDGVTTPTKRTPEQTHIGIFWAYDGTPSLCAPPRLYNQVAVQIADQMGSDAVQLCRLLALVNVSMADTAIAVWESKYHYDFWRPVTGIREADKGTGPTRLGDGNPATLGNPKNTPLGAPASNLFGPNFTPPFPAYPSGHAGLGGALFQTLRRFYGTDRISFTFISDEFNGETRANDGTVRPLRPRRFASLSAAERENFQSRVYLGIHWQFDGASISQGNRVADYVFSNILRPVSHR